MQPDTYRVAPESLTRACDEARFSFQDTSELSTRQTIIGQERGTAAIAFGIDIKSHNFNLFVLGPAGSGRLTAVKHFINERVADSPSPDDWVYVHNFDPPHRPNAIRLPAGQGRQFCLDMEGLIETLRSELATLFESEAYQRAEQQIMESLQTDSEAVIGPIQEMADEKGFALQQTPQGALMIMPVRDGEPLTPDQVQAMSEEERQQLMADRQELEQALQKAFRESQSIQQRAQSAIENLQQDMASQVLDTHMGEMLARYDLHGEVIDYLQAVRDDILQSLDEFQNGSDDGPPTTPQELMARRQQLAANNSNRYTVNVLVSHQPEDGAPVVLLDLPTYQNLVGRIEHVARFGVLSTDFSHIRSGALHEANGGFLIVRALDILQHPFAWEALKRALSRQEVTIEQPDIANPTVNTTEQLQPEPIPLDIKVVLVGSAWLYYTLYAEDDQFRELFRVKADFDNIMDRTEENEDAYARFIATLCHHEDLLHFNAAAVRRVVDYGSWLAADQQKLSTQFGQLAPLIYESVYFAEQNGHETVTAADVQAAIEANTYRNNLLETRSHERILDGTVYIDVEGEVVGQVNGLVVVQQGDYSFGLPSRLTARVFMGRKDVVQIDRESRMTGPIHDKGVMILQGYLGGRYAQDYPLRLTATLSFEQTYGAIEGDSASSTELYSLLSALSDFPIKQGIAVTGSVNQRGQIQPIGGVTQKVEGFYAICKARGLTGEQGVIIPKTNVRHLMLNQEVVDAVAEGQFHVYAVETVDEGIAILTGQEPETIHQAVDERLRSLAEAIAAFGDTEDDEGQV